MLLYDLLRFFDNLIVAYILEATLYIPRLLHVSKVAGVEICDA